MVVVPDSSGGLVRWLVGRAVDPHRPPRFQALSGPKPVLGLGRLGPEPPWEVVAEGLFDWLALTRWGLPAVAALGTQGLERVASALRGCPRVFLAFDNDDAVREATERLLTLLGRRAVAVALPQGVGDVGELAARPHGRDWPLTIDLDSTICETSSLTTVVTRQLARDGVRRLCVPEHRAWAPADSPVAPLDALPRATPAADIDVRSIRPRCPRTLGRIAAWNR